MSHLPASKLHGQPEGPLGTDAPSFFLRAFRNLPCAGALLTLPVYQHLAQQGVRPPGGASPLGFLLSSRSPEDVSRGLQALYEQGDRRVMIWIERFLETFYEGSAPTWTSIRDVLQLRGHFLPDNSLGLLRVYLCPPDLPGDPEALRFLCQTMSGTRWTLGGRTLRIEFALLESQHAPAY